MAELKYLSVMLDNFNNQYDSLTSISGPKGDISSELTSVANQLNDAMSGFTTASSDSKIADLNSGLALAKQAIEVVKSHVDGDLDALLGNGAEVKAIIDEILELRRQGQSWKESGLERVWNNTIGSFVESWHDNDTYKIDQANRTIDQKNEKGEAQLQAMSAAINGVAFGVAGNMKFGGSLGQSVTYPDNYDFDGNKWDQEHPVYDLNFFQEVGCFVLGTVEAGAKIVEGVLDYGTTAVAGVVSIFDKDAGQSIADFAARDLTGEAIEGVLGTENNALYKQSGGRSAGKFIGSTIAHGALWMTGAGAIVSAVSIAGNTTEASLQQGNGVWASLGIGTVTGVASYGLGHVAKAGAAKFTNWVTGTGSNTVVGKVYSTVSNTVGTKFGAGWVENTGGWTLKGAATKVVNVAASPLRGVANLMQGGAKLINNTVGKTGLWQSLGNLDAKADTLATKVVDGVSSKVGSIFNKGGKGATTAPKDITPQNATTENPIDTKTPATTGKGDGATTSTPTQPKTVAKDPKTYGISQDAYDELVAEGYNPGSQEFVDAAQNYAGANPDALNAINTVNNPKTYGINSEAFDELVAEGYNPGSQEFIEATGRYAGANPKAATQTINDLKIGTIQNSATTPAKVSTTGGSSSSSTSGLANTSGSEKVINNPKTYGLSTEAYDELVAEGYTPGTQEFVDASSSYAGSNSKALDVIKTVQDPKTYGITNDAFDELVANGYDPGTKEFIDATRSYAGANPEQAAKTIGSYSSPTSTTTSTTGTGTRTSTTTTASDVTPQIELPETGTTNKDIMEALKKMNPDVKFELNETEGVLTTSADPSKLKLPKGYEYNAKNGITNKHNTSTGIYNSLTTKQDPSLASTTTTTGTTGETGTSTSTGSTSKASTANPTQTNNGAAAVGGIVASLRNNN